MHFVNTEISQKIGRSLSCLTGGKTWVLRDHHSNGNKREPCAKISSHLGQPIIIIATINFISIRVNRHHKRWFSMAMMPIYPLFEMISLRHETSCGGAPLPGIYHLWMLSSSSSSSSSRAKQAQWREANQLTSILRLLILQRNIARTLQTVHGVWIGLGCSGK